MYRLATALSQDKKTKKAPVKMNGRSYLASTLQCSCKRMLLSCFLRTIQQQQQQQRRKYHETNRDIRQFSCLCLFSLSFCRIVSMLMRKRVQSRILDKYYLIKTSFVCSEVYVTVSMLMLNKI